MLFSLCSSSVSHQVLYKPFLLTKSRQQFLHRISYLVLRFHALAKYYERFKYVSMDYFLMKSSEKSRVEKIKSIIEDAEGDPELLLDAYFENSDKLKDSGKMKIDINAASRCVPPLIIAIVCFFLVDFFLFDYVAIFTIVENTKLESSQAIYYPTVIDTVSMTTVIMINSLYCAYLYYYRLLGKIEFKYHLILPMSWWITALLFFIKEGKESFPFVHSWRFLYSSRILFAIFLCSSFMLLVVYKLHPSLSHKRIIGDVSGKALVYGSDYHQEGLTHEDILDDISKGVSNLIKYHEIDGNVIRVVYGLSLLGFIDMALILRENYITLLIFEANQDIYLNERTNKLQSKIGFRLRRDFNLIFAVDEPDIKINRNELRKLLISYSRGLSSIENVKNVSRSLFTDRVSMVLVVGIILILGIFGKEIISNPIPLISVIMATFLSFLLGQRQKR